MNGAIAASASAACVRSDNGLSAPMRSVFR